MPTQATNERLWPALDKVEHIIDALRNGEMVVILDDEERERWLALADRLTITPAANIGAPILPATSTKRCPSRR